MKNHACFLALSLLIFSLFLTSCDAGGSNRVEVEPINGIWQGISEDVVAFLEIEIPNIVLYDWFEREGCYFIDSGTLNRISGDTFVLQIPNSSIDTVSILTEDDKLIIIEEIEGGAIFEKSNADVTEFQECNEQ